MATVSIGETLDVDCTEDRGEPPAVAGLDRPMGDAVGVDDRVRSHLVPRPQGEVVLKHPAKELATPDIELVLELCVGERLRVGAFQPAEQLFDARA